MSHYHETEHLDMSWRSLQGISRSLARSSRIMADPPSSPSPSPVPETQREDPFTLFNPRSIGRGYGQGRGQPPDVYNVDYLDECIERELRGLPNLSEVNVEALQQTVQGQFSDSEDRYPDEPSFEGYKKRPKASKYRVSEPSPTRDDAPSPAKTDSPIDDGLQGVSKLSEDFAVQDEGNPANDAFNYSLDESMFIKGVLPSPTGGNTPSPCSSPLPDHQSIDCNIQSIEPPEPDDHLNFEEAPLPGGGSSKECVASYLGILKEKFKNEPETYIQFESTLNEWNNDFIDLPTMLRKVVHILQPHPEILEYFQTVVPLELAFSTQLPGPPKKVARLFSSTKPRRIRNALILNLLKKQEENQNPNGKMPDISPCQVDELEPRTSEEESDVGNEVCKVSSSQNDLHDEEHCIVKVKGSCELYNEACKTVNFSELSTPEARLQLIGQSKPECDDAASSIDSYHSIYATPHACEKSGDLGEDTKDVPISNKTVQEADDSQVEASGLLGLSREPSPYYACLDFAVVPDLEEPLNEFVLKPEDMVLDNESFMVSDEEVVSFNHSHFYRHNTYRPNDGFCEEEPSSQCGDQVFGVPQKLTLITEKVVSSNSVQSTDKLNPDFPTGAASVGDDPLVNRIASELCELDCLLKTKASSTGYSTAHISGVKPSNFTSASLSYPNGKMPDILPCQVDDLEPRTSEGGSDGNKVCQVSSSQNCLHNEEHCIVKVKESCGYYHEACDVADPTSQLVVAGKVSEEDDWSTITTSTVSDGVESSSDHLIFPEKMKDRNDADTSEKEVIDMDDKKRLIEGLIAPKTFDDDDVGSTKTLDDFIAAAETSEDRIEADTTLICEKTHDFIAIRTAPVVNGMSASGIAQLEPCSTTDIPSDDVAGGLGLLDETGSAEASSDADDGASQISAESVEGKAQADCSVTAEAPKEQDCCSIPMIARKGDLTADEAPAQDIPAIVGSTCPIITPVIGTSTSHLNEKRTSQSSNGSIEHPKYDPVTDLVSSMTKIDLTVAGKDSAVQESPGIDNTSYNTLTDEVAARLGLLDETRSAEATADADDGVALISAESVGVKAQVYCSMTAETPKEHDCPSSPLLAVKGDLAADEAPAQDVPAVVGSPCPIITTVLGTSTSHLNEKRTSVSSNGSIEQPNFDPVMDLVSAMAKIDLSVAGKDSAIQESSEIDKPSLDTLTDEVAAGLGPLDETRSTEATADADGGTAPFLAESVAVKAQVHCSVTAETPEEHDCPSSPFLAVKGDLAADEAPAQDIPAVVGSPRPNITPVIGISASLLNEKRISRTSNGSIEHPNFDPVMDLVSAMAKIDLSVPGKDSAIQESLEIVETSQETVSTLEGTPAPRQSIPWPIRTRPLNCKLVPPGQLQLSGVDPNALAAALPQAVSHAEPSEVD